MGNRIEYILVKFLSLEKELKIEDIKYDNFALWRLYRFRYRQKYLKKHIEDFSSNTQKREMKKWIPLLIRRYLISFFQCLKLLVSGKQYDNIVFAFPRLQKIGSDLYMDKFTDPVIDNSSIGKSVRVFQMSSRTVYDGERWEKGRVVNNEFITLTSMLISLFLWPLFTIPDYAKVWSLHRKLRNVLDLRCKDFIRNCYILSSFKIQSRIYRSVFKRLNSKNVFVVDRMIYLPQIYAAHKCGNLVLEFQHGITIGETELYSGAYDRQIDPDIFLTFGETCKTKYFNIPSEQIVNIGFAYKQITDTLSAQQQRPENSVLIVSSPEISEKIINVARKLATRYKDYNFYIRCHPQEKLTQVQENIIGGYSNLYLDDNTIDSYVVLKSCKHIIGENSSVLFEALNLGKNVGRLNFDGFAPLKFYSQNDNFYYLNSEEDFIEFIMRKLPERGSSIYDDFNPQYLEDLCKI